MASLGLPPGLGWIKSSNAPTSETHLVFQNLELHLQSLSHAGLVSAWSFTPGMEFYTLWALLLAMLFSWSRPDNANNTAKPHSCLYPCPVPVPGSPIHQSWWCCLAAKALREFPRQNLTLATVN